MWNTSDRYKELIYNISTKCLLNIYIEDILIDDNALIDFRISHTLFSSDKIELGTTPSKAIELQIRAEALPEKYDNFYIETGINVDGKNEIVPIGYFTLESIKKDDDLVTLTIVDYMMMFERTLNIYKALPCTAINLLKYICNYCGVELGSTSFTNSDTIINIYDVNLTARQIIGYIAEQAGGFACIGRNGKLYIKKIGKDTSKIDIELFQDYSWGEKFVCNEVDFDNEKQQYYISDTEVNGVDLDNVLDTSLYSNVEGRNIEINPNNLFINNKEQVENIYKEVKGLTLYGFEGQSIIDPALDIGDIVYIEDKPVVYQGEMEFTKKFKGNISSRIETEQKKSTTVGSALSYATRMRNLKEEVEETQKQVFEKVDKNMIIQSINESSSKEEISENNKTINPEKLNINGIESINGNFGVDEKGNMYCNDAKINGKFYNKDKEISFTDDCIHVSKGLQGFNVNFFEDQNGIIRAYLTFGKDTLITDSETGGHKLSGIESEIGEEDIWFLIKNSYGIDDGIKLNSNANTGSQIIVGQDPEIDDSSEETNFYNIGTRINSYNIVTPTLIQTSLEKIKKNIKKFDGALKIVEDSDIYKYNLKIEKNTDKKHIGFVIGDKYNTPDEIISNNKKGIDLYSTVSILWEAVKELNQKNNKIYELENKINILNDRLSKQEKGV